YGALYLGHYTEYYLMYDLTGFHSLFFTGGLGWSYLAYSAYLVLALAMFLYALLVKSRFASPAFVVAMVGFLLYAIDMASGNIGALSSTNWTYVINSPGTQIAPIIAEIVLAI